MRRFLIFVLRLYKAGVSPYWPGQCRYLPTCSEYALDAVTRRLVDPLARGYRRGPAAVRGEVACARGRDKNQERQRRHHHGMP